MPIPGKHIQPITKGVRLMTTIAKRLLPTKKPPCEATVRPEVEKWNRRVGNENPTKCRMAAMYRVRQKKLCTKHAQQLALYILLSQFK